jgi:isoleucyl-tRNA synthetase
MSAKYQEYKGLNLPEVAKRVLDKWENENVFQMLGSNKIKYWSN